MVNIKLGHTVVSNCIQLVIFFNYEIREQKGRAQFHGAHKKMHLPLLVHNAKPNGYLALSDTDSQ